MRKNLAWSKAQQVQIRLKKEAVLAEASALFNQKGYHATSLNDVAERLGLTKTALYYYVKNKNDLLYEAYSLALDEIDEATREAEEKGKTGLEKLCHYVRSEAFVHPQASALLNEIDAIENPARRRSLQKRLRKANEQVVEWVSQGVADGSIEPCDPELSARFVMGAFNWIPRWISSSGRGMDEVTDYFVGLLAKSLTSESKG